MIDSQESKLRELILDAIGHREFCDTDHDNGKHIDEIIAFVREIDPLDIEKN